MTKAITTLLKPVAPLLMLLAGTPSAATSQSASNTVLFVVQPPPAGSGQQVDRNFYYHDISLRGHPVHLTSDSLQVPIDQPVFLLQADEAQTPYLIYPGETIHVRVAQGKTRLAIPGNQRRSDELAFFAELVQHLGNMSYAFKLPPFLKKVNSLVQLQQLETMIDQLRGLRLRQLTDDARNQYFSRDFLTIATNSINSTALRDSIELYAFNKDFLQAQQLYQQKIADKVKSVANVPLSSLRFDLQAIADVASVVASGKVRNTDTYGLKDFEQQFKSAERSFSGKYREYLLFKALYDAASRYITIPQQYVNSFYNSSQDPIYKSMLTDRMADSKRVANTDTDILIDAAGRQSSLASILKQHSGNLVLVDLWASWCAPCRAEMKYSKQLVQQYAGKPVRFVYLSIDESRKAWETANEQESLSANSYLLLTPSRAKILADQKIIGVPRYLLIDKTGKVISADAPRPSDPLLVTLIEKHL